MLSLGVRGGAWSRALDAATSALVRARNVTLVVAAGNGRGAPSPRPGPCPNPNSVPILEGLRPMLSLEVSLPGRGPGSGGSGRAARLRAPADTVPASASAFARDHGMGVPGGA